MHGWDDDADPIPSRPDLLDFVAQGCYDDPAAALARVDLLVPELERADDPELLLVARWGQAVLQRGTGVPPETGEATCDLLEQAALDRGGPVWSALASALRATFRLDAGDVGAAVGHLARVDLDQLADDLPGLGGAQLLDTLAMAYSRLRLHDRVDAVRERAVQFLPDRPPLDRAVHWAHSATELAVRGMEPLASGSDQPDLHLLAEAADVATRLSTVPPDLVPDRLRRGADGVRALAAAYRDRPDEALRLLGEDAFDQPDDLPWPERQLTTLAAIHAHVLGGGVAIARALDDGAGSPPVALTHLVLEVCRARERLALESRAGGDAVQVITRLSGLLTQLAWQGMGLMAGAARQALEHQALHAESRTDPLTGVGNRRALDEDLRNMLRFSPMPLSLVLVDIDHFKDVNDRFTHVVGDEVLQQVAGALGQELRTGDRLVRFGGDEFVVLLPLTSDTEAEAVAGRMAQAVRATAWSDVAEGLDVGVTTGCSTLWALSHRRPDGDAEQLFRHADEQLLEAKRHRSPTSTPAAGPPVPPAPAPAPAAAPPPAPAPVPAAAAPAPVPAAVPAVQTPPTDAVASDVFDAPDADEAGSLADSTGPIDVPVTPRGRRAAPARPKPADPPDAASRPKPADPPDAASRPKPAVRPPQPTAAEIRAAATASPLHSPTLPVRPARPAAVRPAAVRPARPAGEPATLPAAKPPAATAPRVTPPAVTPPAVTPAATAPAASASRTAAAPASPAPAPAAPAAPVPLSPAPRSAPPPRPAPVPPPEPPAPPDPLSDPLPEPLQAPLSPAFGLPLYRALLQNPPRVDPYLGALPPADPREHQLTPLGLVLPAVDRSRPPAAAPAAAPPPSSPPAAEAGNAPVRGRRGAGRREQADGHGHGPDDPEPKESQAPVHNGHGGHRHNGHDLNGRAHAGADRPAPRPDGANGHSVDDGPASAGKGTNGSAYPGPRPAREAARRPEPISHRAADRAFDPLDPDDDVDDEPQPRPARPRRRPTIIDLTREDDRRSPFG